MLHFITGTAGTGKTTRLFEEIARHVRSGGRAILLVPEQLSFESERRLYRVLGPRLALSVEVLSFTRLCNSVFRALGGLAQPAVTPAAQYLLMSVALGELRDRLQVYRKSADNASFVQTMLETCGEFQTAGVLPQRLSEAAAQCGGQLGDKLAEMSDIYGTYRALLERGYSDPNDDLIRACALLENRDFFSDYAVFVDGFTTFMAAEFELLGHVIAQSPDCRFALTCDELTDHRHGLGVFSPVQAAVQRLTRLAERAGIPIALPELLREQRRFRHGALAHLGRCFMQPVGEAYEKPVEAVVRLHEAPDRYAEMEYVAASIARLVHDEGFRYREIAVVARDTNLYLRALEALFPQYGVPYFTDMSRGAENHPLVAGLRDAVDAIQSGFATEPVLLLAKCPILGLEAGDVAELENYCYCWSVRGRVWHADFTANPRGLAGASNEDDLALLALVNRTRAAVIGPLLGLKAALSTGGGRGFAAGLFEFLQSVGAPDNLTKWADGLAQDERATFLSESAQLWDAVVGILDVFGTVLGGVEMKQARLCELLKLALGTVETGLPPQTLDQVLVGRADRIRPVDLRAVFVIGAVEGEFPAQVAQGGVFSDAERRRMIQAGIEISAPTLQQAVLERFFAYFAVTLASERLVVSWPRSDLGGQELLPSAIISQIQALLPGIEPDQPAAAYYLTGPGTILERLARESGQGSTLEATLREYARRAGGTETLARMDAARLRPAHHIGDRALTRGLFGEQMRLSPTRVERFYRCPFGYYASDGLGMRTRTKVEFTPLESGSVIHHVLQLLVQRYGGRGLDELSDEQLQTEVEAAIRDYIKARVEDVEVLPHRFRYLFSRLTGMLARLLRRIGRELTQSEFQPVAFELPISSRGGVEPLHLETADGVKVAVEGVVDRVDVMEKNGRRYVRVIDYKSGAKTFALSDVLYGINMQMLLYLFTIEEHGEGALKDCVPAGVLYMPVREAFVNTGREADEDKLAAEREKQWRMNGLLLEDEEVLRGMERELKGIFIPVRLGKNGLDAKSSLAGRAELGRLARKVQDLIVDMAESLSAGGIGATPTVSPDFDTCSYCEYRAVCGREDDDPVRSIAKIDRAEVLKLLEEEYDG